MRTMQAHRCPARSCQRPGAFASRPAVLRGSTCRVQTSASDKQAQVTPSSDRRSVLLGTAASLALWQPALLTTLPAHADESTALYQDTTDRFAITVPAGWARGEGELSGNTGFSGASGARRTVAFFPDDPSAHDVNISVVITNVSVEFTKLGSFGNIDTFATNLINSLDRSYLLRSRIPVSDPIQIAELVDYGGNSQVYNVEYTIRKMPGPQRHLYSSVVLGSNGRYNRLYTVTAQCLEEDLPRYEPLLRSAIKTFKVDLQPGF